MQRFNSARGVMGVYAIVHRDSGRAYIGSAANIGNRWYSHRSALRRGVHKNALIQAAWAEFGESAFRFLILQRVADVAELRPAEQRWLDRGRTWEADTGFNRSPTTNGVGWRYTEEQRARLSAACSRIVRTPEHRANLLAAQRLAAASPEARERGRRVGSAGRGVPKAAAHRAHIGAAQQGSANHRAKLTEDDVREIKRRLASGEKGRHLAREFGVHEVLVSQIKSGSRWRHVT